MALPVDPDDFETGELNNPDRNSPRWNEFIDRFVDQYYETAHWVKRNKNSGVSPLFGADTRSLVAEAAWRVFNDFDQKKQRFESARHWIGRVTKKFHGMLIDQLRRELANHRQMVKALPSDELQQAADAGLRNEPELVESMQEAIAELTDSLPESAAVLQFRVFRAMKWGDVAKASGLTVEQARYRHEAALTYLRDWFDRNAGRSDFPFAPSHS